MRQIVLPILIVTISFSLFGQSVLHTHGGSTISAVISKDGTYVAVAADSRGTGNHGEKDNKTCKIIALGSSTLFLSTGSISYHSDFHEKKVGRFDAFADARSVFKSSPQSDATELTHAWTKTPIKVFGAESPAVLDYIAQEGGNEDGFVSACFITYKNIMSRPDVACVGIKYTPHTSTVFPKYDGASYSGNTTKILSMGVGKDLYDEFFHARSARGWSAIRTCCSKVIGQTLGDKSSTDKILVKASVQFVLDNASAKDKLKLGGPIDYGIFTSQGMTWDKRKPNCYSEDVKSYVPSPKPLPKKSK
jgi:hypothetical protein